MTLQIVGDNGTLGRLKARAGLHENRQSLGGDMGDNVKVYEDAGAWYIVKGLRLLQSNGITGSRSRSGAVYIYDGCWTGDKWSPQRSFGKAFSSRDDANQYLDENFGEIVSSDRSF